MSDCTCGQALTPDELQPRDPYCAVHGDVPDCPRCEGGGVIEGTYKLDGHEIECPDCRGTGAALRFPTAASDATQERDA